MAIVTETRFAHEDGALADTLTTFPNLLVQVVREASTAPSQSVYFLHFEGQDPDAVQAALEEDHTVETASEMAEFDERQLWGIEFATDAKLIGPHVTSVGGFVVDARAATAVVEPRGWHERWLLPDREALNTIWEHARSEGFDFEILELHRQNGSDMQYPGPHKLTEEQRTALKTAYELGYFNEPREAWLEDVADALDLSPSAVSGRIKRGTKSLIEGTLAVDSHDV